jgi:hypothetical protein
MSEDYPGATDLATTMRGRWPWLSREQAWVLACIKIRPDRNENARHIGWDARRRPLIETDRLGTVNRHAQLRNGSPTTPKGPLTLFETPNAETQSAEK